jgi:hypothetical protein
VPPFYEHFCQTEWVVNVTAASEGHYVRFGSGGGLLIWALANGLCEPVDDGSVGGAVVPTKPEDFSAGLRELNEPLYDPAASRRAGGRGKVDGL